MGGKNSPCKCFLFVKKALNLAWYITKTLPFLSEVHLQLLIIISWKQHELQQCHEFIIHQRLECVCASAIKTKAIILKKTAEMLPIKKESFN